jgi:ketosteroid isomerase-like protein
MSTVENQKTFEQAARRGSDNTALRATVYAYYKAVNDGRWEDVTNFFHEDGVLLVPSQEPKVGHDVILKFYSAHGRYFPEHHDDVPVLMVDGNRVMTLIEFHGVDREGERINYWNAGVFTIEDGRFRQYRVIFDTAELPAWLRRRNARWNDGSEAG